AAAESWTSDGFLSRPTGDHGARSPLAVRLGPDFRHRCEDARLGPFVSCRAGVGRSSSLVLARLLAGRFREQGLAAALEFLQARRPPAQPTPEQIEAAQQAALEYPA